MDDTPIPFLYANEVRVTTTVWDTTIRLAQAYPSAGGAGDAPETRTIGAVAVSHTTAKFLVLAIQAQLARHERKYGEIKLPGDLLKQIESITSQDL